jgi:hypothetical protein
MQTFNYTNRIKIKQHEALFSFKESDDNVPEFNALFKFDTKAYPPDSSIYVEVYHKETRQRFDYGKVSNITPPKDRKLDKIDLTGSVLFNVIIVDSSTKHGLLLASGRGFKANADGEEENKSSLLNVRSMPLGQLPWKLEFEIGCSPELYLSSNIPNAVDKLRVDPIFQSLILPAALKEILTFYFWDEDQESDEAKQWLTFATTFADNPPDSNDPSELLIWVDEVIMEFSKRFELCDRLMNEIREEDI